jgi:hypothetical protein
VVRDESPEETSHSAKMGGLGEHFELAMRLATAAPWLTLGIAGFVILILSTVVERRGARLRTDLYEALRIGLPEKQKQ